MSALIDVKQALESELIAAFPTLKVATEARSFTPPNDLYLKAQFRVDSPEDPVIGDFYYRERVSFQIFVCDLLKNGPIRAMQVSEEIRTLFNKGYFIQRGQTRISVLRTPQVSSVGTTNDRVIIPVLVPVLAEVFKP